MTDRLRDLLAAVALLVIGGIVFLMCAYILLHIFKLGEAF